MTSVTNSSGLNFQNGINPLGRKVRALEADVDTLKKELAALKTGGVKPAAASTTAEVTSNVASELDALRRELAALKASGFGKGEKGDKGDKGDRGEKGEKGEKGDKGDQGPMTYIAMPPTMMPTATATVNA